MALSVSIAEFLEKIAIIARMIQLSNAAEEETMMQGKNRKAALRKVTHDSQWL